MSDTKKALTPDLAIAEAFWSGFAPGEPIRLRYLLRGHASHEREYKTVPAAWPDVLRFQGMGYGIFYFPNRVDEGTKGFARDRDVRQVRAYWADCDDSGIPGSWEWHVTPDLIVHTSQAANGTQKGQILWRVQAGAGGGMVADTVYGDMFKEQECRVIAKYDADAAASNIARVLRLPGTLHLKDPARPQLVTFERVYTGELRRDSAVLEGLPEAPPRAEPAAEKQSAPVTQERLETMLGWIDPDCDYDAWKNVVIAIRSTKLDTTIPAALAAKFPGLVASEDERLREIAHRWSRGELDRRGKYADGPPLAYYSKDSGAPCDGVLDQLFDNVDPNREGGATFGSIVHAAKIAGWEPPPPSHPGKTTEEPKAGDKLEGDEERFRGFRLADPVQPIEWWDKDKLFPKYDHGGSLLIYAKQGMHKTNIALRFAMDIIEAGGVVVYMAGEGAHGVRGGRLPAHLKKRGWSAEGLRDRWITIPATPMFKDPKNVQAAVRALRKQGVEPNGPRRIVIFIDTLATAGMGLEENTSELSEQLTGNGAVGTLARVFRALVVVLAHEGKSEGKDARGHSGIMGNVDVALQLKTRKEVGAIEVRVAKMRDGEDDRSVYFRVRKGEVPVPERIDLPEFKDLDKEQQRITAEQKRQARADEDKSDAQLLRERVAGLIKELGWTTWEKGLTHNQVAETMTTRDHGPMPTPMQGMENYTAWITAADKLANKLAQTARASASAPHGSARKGFSERKQMEIFWRWHDNATYPLQPPGQSPILVPDPEAAE